MATKYILCCDRCGLEMPDEKADEENWGNMPKDPVGNEWADLCPTCLEEFENKLGEFYGH